MVKKVATLSIVALTSFVIATAIIRAGASAIPHGKHLPPWAWPVIILGPFVIMLLAIAIHELGHYAGGKLVNFRFLLFGVGPLRVERVSGALNIRFNRSLAVAGGLCAMAPEDDRNLPRRMAVMVAGGPAASLLLALVCAIAALLLSPARVANLFWSIAAGSGAIALLTAIPTSAGHFYSDGQRLLSLLRGGPQAQRWCAMMALVGCGLGPIRPRDWDESLVQGLIAGIDNTYDGIGAAMMAYQWSLDRSDIERARHWIDIALANQEAWPKTLRATMLLEGAFFYARYAAAPEQARQWFNTAGEGFGVQRYSRLRAEAAVLQAEGKSLEAAAAIDQARQFLARTPPGGLVTAERDWLDGLATPKGV